MICGLLCPWYFMMGLPGIWRHGACKRSLSTKVHFHVCRSWEPYLIFQSLGSSQFSFKLQHFCEHCYKPEKGQVFKMEKCINEPSPLKIFPDGWMPSAGELEKSPKPLTTLASLPICLCFHVHSDLCEGGRSCSLRLSQKTTMRWTKEFLDLLLQGRKGSRFLSRLQSILQVRYS